MKEGGSTVKQKEMDKFLFELSYLNTTALFALEGSCGAAAVFRKAGRCLGKRIDEKQPPYQKVKSIFLRTSNI